jgi:hypothetical protein
MLFHRSKSLSVAKRLSLEGDAIQIERHQCRMRGNALLGRLVADAEPRAFSVSAMWRREKLLRSFIQPCRRALAAHPPKWVERLGVCPGAAAALRAPL